MPKKQNQKDNKPDVVAMANKKRHIYLLEKLQKNKPLTKSEIKELAAFEKGSQSPALVNSQYLVATAFDVSIRTVARWVKDGMPVRKDGYYNILEIKDWRTSISAHRRYKMTKQGRMEKRDEEKKALPSQVNDSDIPDEWKKDYDRNTDWIMEKEKWDAILKRQKAEEAAGILINKEDAVATLKIAVENVKARFLALPKQLSPELAMMSDPIQISEVLDIRIREIINSFANGKF